MLVSGGTFSQPGGNLVIGQHAPGILTINGGLVALGSYLEFGVGAGNSSGSVNLNGGQLNTSYFYTGVGSPANVINFNGGLLQLTASSSSLFQPTGDFTVNVGNGGAIINLNGYSTTCSNALNGIGTGGLTVYSATPGTLTLGGNNTYTGPTQITGCSVILNNSTLGSGGALTINGGQVDLGGASQTVGAVSVTAAAAAGNTIQNGTLLGTAYLISNSSGNAIITASLQDSSTGSSSFTMSGTGGIATLTANNTFTGPTNVTGGTLVVDNSNNTGASLANTSLSVASSAWFVAKGNTNIGGSLSVAGSGSLDLRDGLANNLTSLSVNGNLSLGSGGQGSSLFFELGNSNNDLLNANGMRHAIWQEYDQPLRRGRQQPVHRDLYADRGRAAASAPTISL